MFLRFIPNYSAVAMNITDMSSKTFNWDETTWIVNHRAAFDRFKDAIQASLTLFYPDYGLNWILRTDASLTGCGVILYQEYVAPDGILQEQVYTTSVNFSGPATRWPTIEQEVFAIYFGVRKLKYLLMCNVFVLETDHRNLVWMGTSLVAKIIRWRIYLQGLFNMTIRHIKGKDNITADWLSWIHSVERDATSPTLESTDAVTTDTLLCTPRDCFLKVHRGLTHRIFHQYVNLRRSASLDLTVILCNRDREHEGYHQQDKYLRDITCYKRVG